MRSINRRDFMFGSGLTTAVSSAVFSGNKLLWAASPGPASVPPSDRLRLGVIGMGMRAFQDVASFVSATGTELVMAADVYDGRLTRAKEIYKDVETTKDYRRILDRKDIDIVLIATPDQWKKRMILETMESGKDVYCEKPLTYTVQDGFDIIKAEKRYNKILQVGSQEVASPLVELIKKWVDDGKLGQITQAKSSVCRNSAEGACYYPIAPDASEKTIDWKNFLGPAPDRPFDVKRYFHWRVYWDYSGGMATDLGVHYVNTLHYVLGLTAPRSVVCYGGSYHWNKIYPETEIPDTIDILYEYPGMTSHFSVNLSTTGPDQGTYIYGTMGTAFMGRGGLTFSEGSQKPSWSWVINAWPIALQKQWLKEQNMISLAREYAPGTDTTSVRSEVYEGVGDITDLHVQSFVDSVRTRKPTREGAVQGSNAALAGHMANLSYKNGGRKVTWDGKQMNLA